MANKFDPVHRSGTLIYSYHELTDWIHRATRSAEDQTRWALWEQRIAVAATHGEGDCPVCGWPRGGRGFVRAPALPGEWAFGKLFACPKCWPWPMGKGPAGSLTEGQMRQADSAAMRMEAKGL